MGTKKLLSFKSAAELCAREFTVSAWDADGNEVTDRIWVRTMSAPEMREADNAHAEAVQQARLDYALGTPKHDALQNELMDMSTESLVNMILNFELGDITAQARKRVPALMPIDLSRCSTELARAKAEDAYEKVEAEYRERIATAMREITDKRRESLLAITREELVATGLRFAVKLGIMRDTLGLQDDFRIFYGVHEADNHEARYFENIDEVQSLPDGIRSPLLAAVREVDLVQPVDIKNSQGRSVMQIGPAENTPEATQDRSTTNSRVPGSRRKRSPGGRAKSSSG